MKDYLILNIIDETEIDCQHNRMLFLIQEKEEHQESHNIHNIQQYPELIVDFA